MSLRIVSIAIIVFSGVFHRSLARLDSPEEGYYGYEPLPKIRLVSRPGSRELISGATARVKRGAAYPGGHGDFSGVAKMSTFAALGSYGGFLGHSGGAGGSVAGGYNAGAGGAGGDGGITISGALGSYGGHLGHKSPVVLSSGGYGNGGLLFGKI